MATYFRTDGWVKSALGPAVPGAQIYICNQPANTNTAPPSPLATIYSDVNGLVPITQPVIADGFGHYDFYTSPGTYTLVIAYGGVIQQVYPDQSVAEGSPIAGSILSADGTVTVSQDGSGNTNLSVVKVQQLENYLWSFDSLRALQGTFTTGAAFGYNNSTNNGIIAIQLVLNLAITIKKITAGIGTSNGGKFCFAIYDSTGTTKLLDAGTNAFDGTTAGKQVVTLGSPVTLPSGTYLCASGCTIAATSSGQGYLYPNSGGAIALWGNDGTTRVMQAGNLISGGAMPATLGTLAAILPASGVPGFFLTT